MKKDREAWKTIFSDDLFGEIFWHVSFVGQAL
jgi:hypothetical protein